jgi:parvulin-like peptidyl-prolyl isomerase
MASISESVPAAGPLAPALRAARRVLREPLVHFLAIGAALFLGLQLIKSLERPTVRLDEKELNQLVEYWKLSSGREPTKAELTAIIRDRVDEELLAKEAQRLGMDQGDMIVRRRLAQKMAFAAEDLGAVSEPAEAVLRAFYDQTKAQYAVPGHVAFAQVFFTADRGQAQARAAASDALMRVRAGGSPKGDPFLLPLTYADASLDDLTRDYGPAYAKAVAAAPAGAWAGPVQSAYGWHLVRVESRDAPSIQPFEAVKSEVRDAWIAQRREEANAAFLASLRKRYRVVVAGEGQ